MLEVVASRAAATVHNKSRQGEDHISLQKTLS